MQGGGPGRRCMRCPQLQVHCCALASRLHVLTGWRPAGAQVVASGVVDKYIGESARVIREMFR